MSGGSDGSGRGYFITVEGIEGVGKSTQVRIAVEHLRRLGKSVVETREPGGTEVGELIRTLVIGKGHPPMARETELLLMFAGRAEHLDKVIKPALAAGSIVVCDRFTDASYAYQGAGRKIPKSRVEILENYLQGPLRPNLTLLLDAPVPLALARANDRSTADRFEAEGQAFFESVRTCYLQLGRVHNDRIRVIDATQPIERVAADIWVQVERLLA